MDLSEKENNSAEALRYKQRAYFLSDQSCTRSNDCWILCWTAKPHSNYLPIGHLRDGALTCRSCPAAVILGCREHRREACLLTQLSVYTDFTSHPPAVLASPPLSNPPLHPFPHPALPLSFSWTHLFHPSLSHTYITSLSLPCCPAPSGTSSSLTVCSPHLPIPAQSRLFLLPLSNPGRLPALLSVAVLAAHC